MTVTAVILGEQLAVLHGDAITQQCPLCQPVESWWCFGIRVSVLLMGWALEVGKKSVCGCVWGADQTQM